MGALEGLPAGTLGSRTFPVNTIVSELSSAIRNAKGCSMVTSTAFDPNLELMDTSEEERKKN